MCAHVCAFQQEPKKTDRGSGVPLYPLSFFLHRASMKRSEPTNTNTLQTAGEAWAGPKHNRTNTLQTANTFQTAGEAWAGPKHNRTGQQRVPVQCGALKRLEGPRTQLSLQENVHEGRSLEQTPHLSRQTRCLHTPPNRRSALCFLFCEGVKGDGEGGFEQ